MNGVIDMVASLRDGSLLQKLREGKYNPKDRENIAQTIKEEGASNNQSISELKHQIDQLTNELDSKQAYKTIIDESRACLAPVIVHINGYSGAGKTWLAKHLQKSIPSLITQDLDEFLMSPDEFHEQSKHHQTILLKNQQLFMEEEIRSFVEKHACSRIILFYGTACFTPDEATYPSFPSGTHLIWYDVDIFVSTEQALDRQIDWINDNRQEFINKSMYNTQDNVMKYLTTYYSGAHRMAEWKPLKNICMKRGYMALPNLADIEAYVTNLIL